MAWGLIIKKKLIDVSMQQVETPVMWGMLAHMTISLSSFVSNSCWDSVCIAVAVRILSAMK
jgi:hypothetical protein